MLQRMSETLFFLIKQCEKYFIFFGECASNKCCAFENLTRVSFCKFARVANALCIIADHHKTVLLLKSKSGTTNQNDFIRGKPRNICRFKNNYYENSHKHSLFLGYLFKVSKVPSCSCSNTLKDIKVSS